VGREKNPSMRTCVSLSSKSSVVTPSQVTETASAVSDVAAAIGQSRSSRLGLSCHSQARTPSASANAAMAATASRRRIRARFSRRLRMVCPAIAQPRCEPGAPRAVPDNCRSHSRVVPSVSIPAPGSADEMLRRWARTPRRQCWQLMLLQYCVCLP